MREQVSTMAKITDVVFSFRLLKEAGVVRVRIQKNDWG